jgi:hypothetical protein
MKSLTLFVMAASLSLAGGLFAQEQKSGSARTLTVESKWTGVNLAIYDVKRIQDNRLLVSVRVIATAKAPKEGIVLGEKPAIPASATKEEIGTGRYNAKPFSLASSTMTDDQTLQKYPVLPPVAPPGKAYFPGELANGLLPGQAETLTIQFTAPPAPPLVEGREPPKQTVSFLLTGAKGPILRVPIPPPGAE